MVVGIGGGKTMDTAKAVADNYNAAVIIVPTTASTDAPAMGLSVIYTAAGEHVGARHYKKNPDLVLLDTDILAKAPIRFLVAGMGDALSTYPECRANVQSASPQLRQQRLSPDHRLHRRVQGVPRDHPDQGRQRQAGRRAGPVHQGRGGRHRGQHPAVRPGRAERLPARALTPSPRASPSWSPAPSCCTAKWWPSASWCSSSWRAPPAEELDELYTFFEEVGLPTTFDDLGIPDATEADIRKVAETSMHSYWDVEPFAVNPQMVFDGIMMANTLGKRRKGL